jgi:hypothetical protein
LGSLTQKFNSIPFATQGWSPGDEMLPYRIKYLSTPTSSNIMDLAQKIQLFTINVITDLATGAPFGDLKSDAEQHEYLRTATEAQPEFVMIGSVPALTKIIQIP